MLRPLALLLSASLTCAVLHFFGFTGLFVCFGLAFLTLVFSIEGEDVEASGPESGTQPAVL